MKLIYVCPGSENCIDEALIVVSDDYDEAQVLSDAADYGVDDPYVESVFDLEPGAGSFSYPAEFRVYVG